MVVGFPKQKLRHLKRREAAKRLKLLFYFGSEKKVESVPGFFFFFGDETNSVLPLVGVAPLWRTAIVQFFASESEVKFVRK